MARALRAFLDAVVDGPFTAVVHDWGGPIAFGAIAEKPADLERAILINTTLLPDFQPPRYWRPFVGPRFGDLAVLRLNLVRWALPFLLKSARAQSVRKAYAGPLARLSTRRTVLGLERLEGFAALTGRVHTRLGDMQVPALVIWGHPDPYFPSTELPRVARCFRDVEVVELPAGGHFPQEDAPQAVTAAVLDFLARTARP